MTDVIGVARPRLDAPRNRGQTRFAADGYVHGLLRPPRSLHGNSRSHPAHQRCRRARDLRGRRRADGGRPAHGHAEHRPHGRGSGARGGHLRRPAGGDGRRGDRGCRSGPGEAVFVDYEPLEAVIDVEAAMEPNACLARRVDEATEGGDLESIHAGASGGEHDHDEQLSGNVLDRVHRSRGDAAAALSSSQVVVSGHSERRGSTRRTSSPRRRPRGSSRTARCRSRSRRRAPSSAARSSPGRSGWRWTGSDHRRAAGGRLRREVRARRAAGGGAALALPTRAAGDDPPGGLRRHEPLGAGDRAGDRRAQGRHAYRHTRHDRRPRIERGQGVEGIVLLVAGPYRWEAMDVRGYGVQTNRFTFGAYRGPGAPTAAFAVETSSMSSPPSSSWIRSSSGTRTLSWRAIRASPARCRRSAPSRSPRPRKHAVGEAESLPEGEGISVAVGYWPGGNEAGRSRLPR